jgi:hypothetical protein
LLQHFHDDIASGGDGKNNNHPHVFRLNDRVHIHLTSANRRALASLLVSSNDEVLQQWYADGYDHALHWLRRHGESIHFVPICP